MALVFANASHATPKASKQLQDFLRTTKSLTASFKQIQLNKTGMPTQTLIGKFYLQRPKKFRWNYQKPYVQQIIAQEEKILFYDKDLAQVTIKKIEQSSGSALSLLLNGNTALTENFVLERQEQEANLFWIKLLPKDAQSNFKYLKIGMENGKLKAMELNDNFGQLTRIYFSDLKINVAIASNIFEFIMPEDVDIFNE